MKICPTCGSEHPDDIQFCPKDGSTLRSQSGSGDLIGTVIADRYHVQKKLGEGGMGAVYLAEHVRMGRKSAIKVMTQAMANDPEAIQRFNREAANAARINHPNVCAIYDFGETDDGTIYLAMEFIEGEALSDTIQREGTLHPERAADILRQAADALAQAHEMEIIHRDLKPDNIMLTTTRDGRDLVKVVDFGIAKATGPEPGQNVTKTGLVVGTPEYMSPEQLSGDVLDGRSDLYSLALVFFRMLTGKLPFAADTAQETMIKRLTDEPERLNEALPGADFPSRLQEVMDRALARMPADRYASTIDFARDVIAALQGADTTQVVAAQDQATQLIKQAEPGAGAGVTAPIPDTRVSAAAGTPTPDTPQPGVTEIVQEPGRRRPQTRLIAAGIAVVILGSGAVAVMSRVGDNGGSPATLDSAEVATKSETTDSAPSPGGLGGDARRGETPDGHSNDKQTPDRRIPPVVPDTTAKDTEKTTEIDTLSISAELDRLFEEVEASASPLVLGRARSTARRYWNQQDLTTGLRGFAARIIGWTYQQQDSTDRACDWYGKAFDLEPDNKTNQQFVKMLRCN